MDFAAECGGLTGQIYLLGLYTCIAACWKETMSASNFCQLFVQQAMLASHQVFRDGRGSRCLMRLLLALPRKAAPSKVLILDVTLCYLPQVLKAVPVPLEVFQLLYPRISVTHSYRRRCRRESRQRR